MAGAISEEAAHRAYRIALQHIEAVLGDDTTFMQDLEKVGRGLFGRKWGGVWPSDRIPTLTAAKPYAILNVDKSGLPGSHWVAIAKDGPGVFMYDSFARPAKSLIPNLKLSGNGPVRAEVAADVEQAEAENNCGPRALAWLAVADILGLPAAKLI